MNDYDSAVPRAACAVAALAMTALTIGALVVLPATLANDTPSDTVAGAPPPAIEALSVGPGHRGAAPDAAPDDHANGG